MNKVTSQTTNIPQLYFTLLKQHVATLQLIKYEYKLTYIPIICNTFKGTEIYISHYGQARHKSEKAIKFCMSIRIGTETRKGFPAKMCILLLRLVSSFKKYFIEHLKPGEVGPS